MSRNRTVSRRRFIAAAGRGAAVPILAMSGGSAGDALGQNQSSASKVTKDTVKMPMRKLGKTGVDVSILGIGGGGRGRNPQIRGTLQRPDVQQEAERILHQALDAGVNYIDTCAGYGESERIIGLVAATRRKEMFLATKCDKCNATGDQLRKELEQSLDRLQTDKIDLWQIHNIRNLTDVDAIFQKDRAVDVFQNAKEQGMARFIGITVHGSRTVIEKTLARCRQAGVTMDTLLMSFNVADQLAGGHGKQVLEEHPSIGKIAMKVFASDGAAIIHKKGIPAETALRYVLTQGFATAVVGIHTPEELAENIRIARSFKPCTDQECRQIEERVTGQANGLWALRA